MEDACIREYQYSIGKRRDGEDFEPAMVARADAEGAASLTSIEEAFQPKFAKLRLV